MFNIVEVEQGYLFRTFRTIGAAVMDVHDKKTRSRNMKAIRNRDTKPEVKVRKLLHRHGFRYRIAPAAILGKPDIWLAKWNTAIFVNGCFWHMHDCGFFKLPKSRTDFWADKLARNRDRDKETISRLNSMGIRVLTIWECSLKGTNRLGEETILRLVKTFLLTECYSASIDAHGLAII